MYVHWPFCKNRCTYCDFNAFPYQEKRYAEYTKAILEEIERYERSESVHTLYFGGGTPSHVPVEFLAQVIEALQKKFDMRHLEEFTVEANPEDVTADWIEQIKALGVNRLSMGIQSLDDEILQRIGRMHSGEDAMLAMQTALDCGIYNLSIDLMVGLPGQTVNSLKKDVDRVLAFPISHLSAYSLTIAEHTRMYRQREEGMDFPTEDEERDMFHRLVEKLEDHGLSRYEISNFAKPGFESKHNLTYWHMHNYIGFGLSAASFIDGVHFMNSHSYRKYLRGEGRESEKLTKEELYTEILLSGLRLKEGVDIETLKEKTGIEPQREKVQELIDRGLLQEGERLLCTDIGLDLLDQILVALMP